MITHIFFSCIMQEIGVDNMSYKALYRTYRPQTFEDVAGQSHVTITLKNAIKENRIAA